MPDKIINIDGSAGQGMHKVNTYGFPKIENAVSRSTIYREQKKGVSELKCDPACDVKGQAQMAQVLGDKYGQWDNGRVVRRLDLPCVKVGKNYFYCTTSVYYYLENEHLPMRNETWAGNFDKNRWTNPS